MSNKDLENEVREYQKLFGDVKSEIAKVVVGQEALVHRLLMRSAVDCWTGCGA